MSKKIIELIMIIIIMTDNSMEIALSNLLEKIKSNKKKILNYTLKGSIWFFIIKGTISTAIILLGIFYLTN
ncbi:MAG: hypothetical protein Ct9H300mP6_07930 [Gammaproteobacteria bacterium]|nr:MAG: hypothetical protein Ct9H300mP6_07930 [Gammaproteobacteria bacterium]